MASDIYNTGQSNVTGAYNAGTNAVGSFDPNAWQKATNSGLNDIKNSQDSTQASYIDSFKKQILSQPSATTLYNTANEKFNVPALQNTSNQLTNAVLQAPMSNLNAARGFNYDNNQVQQKTAQDLMYLTPQANAAQNNANTANTNAANYVTQGMAQNAYELQPTQEQGQYLMDSYARQQSGFTTTQQSQLDGLKQKMMSGVQLSSDEMAAFSQLTSAESSYQSSLASANAQIKAAQIGASNVTIPQGSTYFNPGTNGYYTPNVGAGVLK